MDARYWWQLGVVYEILVPSFQDSNGDGWGDLQGLISRLDYINELGVETLWLTPVARSPMYDVGYDVTAFTEIDPLFGTMDDFATLVEEAHRRSLHVVMDFVPNHTSVEHSWFQESQRSRDNQFANWFIWADAKPDGSSPNNWIDRFGTSAWTWCESRQQFYLGSFSPQQPDLNWRNRDVRAAIYDAIRFWLKKGVDGLRVDALAHFIKDKYLRDNPPNIGYDDSQEPSNLLALIYNQNQPELLDIIREMRSVFDEFQERVFIGEVYQSPEQITAYQAAGAQLLLSTSILQTQFEPHHLRYIIDMVEGRTAVDAWPAQCSGNHDIGRVCDRVAQSNLRLAAILHFTLRGTPTMYYGEELGLCRVHVPEDRRRDPSGKKDERYGRDCYRSPMPWNSTDNGGFTSGEPWLPIDESTLSKNVQSQLEDSGSLLNFYRQLLAFRKNNKVLCAGDYRPVDTPSPIVAYTRNIGEDRMLVVLNIGDTPQSFDVRQFIGPSTCAEVLFSTVFRESETCTTSIELGPREGLIARLQEESSGR